MVVIKRSQIKSDRTRKLMPHALFSHNPEYCVDIIHAHKPAFTPRVAFILGSGLGALA
ncbi:TPA: purine-nucleoside phosphorylase, partial [Salmonella enterica]